MFNQVINQIRRESSRREHGQTVKCSACLVGVRFRAYPELVDCSRTNKMHNAETDRVCAYFVGAGDES